MFSNSQMANYYDWQSTYPDRPIYYTDFNDSMDYLKRINYRTNNLEDYAIIYYANLNKYRESHNA